MDRLAALRPPPGPPQLVHGDLTGNVLLSPHGGKPGIIDVSPYWRPAAYAEGVVAADALTWHNAPVSLFFALDVSREAVARGLLFRLLTMVHEDGRTPDSTAARRAFERHELTADVLGL